MSLHEYILPISIGIGCIVTCIVAELVSESNLAAEKYAEAAVLAERSKENTDILAKNLTVIAEKDRVLAKEAEISTRLVNEWKNSSGYSSQMEAINKSLSDEIEQIKEEFNLEDRKNTIINKANAQINDIKVSMNYDGRVDELNGKIESAKKNYELQKNTMKIACKGDDSAFNQLKQAAKKVKNESVNQAKQSLDNLNKQFSERSKAIEVRRDIDISKVENELKDKVSHARAHYDKDIRALDKNLSEKIKQVNADILKSRSYEDNLKVQEAAEYANKVENIESLEATKQEDILESMTTKDKIAALLAEKKIPKIGFLAVATLPLIPVAMLVWKYVKDIRYILTSVDKMKGVMIYA